MKKIISILITSLLLFNGIFTWIWINQANADWFSTNNWKIIDKTKDNNFKMLKWTPFKFSFYNKLYNYFRLTDDGAIVFWVSPDNATLEEWIYLDNKNDALIKTATWKSTEVTFTVNKTKVILPAWKNYQNINWQYKVSDWISEVDIKQWIKILLNSEEEIKSSNWLYWIKIDDYSAIEIYKDNILYNDAWTNNYIMITPWFINLDLSDKDNKWHGIYEKEYYDSKWNLYAVWYMWYWYVEELVWNKYVTTNKEVQYWIVLYNNTYYNNVRLFYWDIDTSITTPVFVWISNWNATDKLNTAYSNMQLWSLDKKDDIVIDGSKIFQELVFPLWYEPDALDENNDLILDYEERDTLAPYPFLNKPKSKFALKFKVKVNTDRVVCQREYVTSEWGDTLRWWKLDSNRADFDDVDTFCFSAETPWIVILDNASYAKGWYKVWQSKCVVSHLSLMWFNASSIWWNIKTDNNCWMTYKIKTIEKDLSLENTSPYSVLSKFSDDVDVRPVDTTQTINNQSIRFAQPKSIMVEKDWTLKEISIQIPNFKTQWIDMISSKVTYLYGNNGVNSYLLYTANRWDKWKILKEVNNKIISYVWVLDSTILLFFEDGTYIRNIESWLGDWKEYKLTNYKKINDFGLITNRSWILVWNEWRMWKTTNAWDSFEEINIRQMTDLQTDENLQSVDIYWSNNIWVATNKWNILYSINGWTTYYKKTTWTTLEHVLEKFEDWASVYKSKLWRTSVWYYSSYIDKEQNKSLKFSNDYQYMPWCILWNTPLQWYNQDVYNKTNLEPFTVNENGKWFPKWDLYIDYYIDTNETLKEVKTITLEDTYSNKITVNVKNIFDLNWKKQKIWWNTVKVEIRDYISDFYTLNAPNTSASAIERFQNIDKYKLNDTTIWLTTGEKIWIWKISFAPSTNITNVIEVNKFNWVMTNTANRTCKTDSDKLYTNLIDWYYDLKSFAWTDNSLKWFLTLDIYVEDKNKWWIDTIELWNDDTKKIIWKDIKKFSNAWSDVINDGWNTFTLPFQSNWNTNIQAVNQKDINWWYLSFLEIYGANSTDTSYNRYALNNLRYSSVAQTNLVWIRFFNTKDWLAFNESSSFITNNNTSWWNNWNFSRWAWTNMKLLDFIKIRWRELYAIWNDNQWWFSYYSLDKWKNYKLYFSDSWIKLKDFDLIDFDDWLAVSENNTLYEFVLEAD